MTKSLVEQIDALLPQTQCSKCGYPGCLPYAEAISKGEADINQCPPGGKQGIAKLANLLGVAVKPLNPAFGAERPRLVAVINEAECIGCTKCIPPCPVDAIIGAAKLMHTVIAEQCTGCELCISPCPVNCISMEDTILPTWDSVQAERARRHYEAKKQRITQLEAERVERLNKQKQLLATLKNVEFKA